MVYIYYQWYAFKLILDVLLAEFEYRIIFQYGVQVEFCLNVKTSKGIKPTSHFCTISAVSKRKHCQFNEGIFTFPKHEPNRSSKTQLL